jgi:hypothetical protein
MEPEFPFISIVQNGNYLPASFAKIPIKAPFSHPTFATTRIPGFQHRFDSVESQQFRDTLDTALSPLLCRRPSCEVLVLHFGQ